MIHQRHRETDRRTERQKTGNRKTTLCTIAHREVISQIPQTQQHFKTCDRLLWQAMHKHNVRYFTQVTQIQRFKHSLTITVAWGKLQVATGDRKSIYFYKPASLIQEVLRKNRYRTNITHCPALPGRRPLKLMSCLYSDSSITCTFSLYFQSEMFATSTSLKKTLSSQTRTWTWSSELTR